MILETFMRSDYPLTFFTDPVYNSAIENRIYVSSVAVLRCGGKIYNPVWVILASVFCYMAVCEKVSSEILILVLDSQDRTLKRNY